MRAKDMKHWMKLIEHEDKAEVDNKEGHEGTGDIWKLLVKFIRHIWETGKIP